MTNHFTNAPTVGSDDYNTTTDDLQARVQWLEQRLNDAQEHSAPKEKKKKGGFSWKKFIKVTSAVVPLLALAPQTINAIARYKAANAGGKKNGQR